MNKRRTASWRTKLLVLLLVFSLVPAVAVAVTGFQTTQRTMREATLDGLEALAQAKAEAIDQFTDNRRRDVERMASIIGEHLHAVQELEAELPSPPPTGPEKPPPALEDAEAIEPDGTPRPPPEGEDEETPETAQALPEPPAGPEASSEAERALTEARDALTQELGVLLWDQGAFEEILVMDPSGVVVASTFSAHTGNTAASLEYFERGRKATFVQPVFMSPITEQLTMVIATPIRNRASNDIGVLAARLNLKGFFRLVNDFTALGRTGETVVGKKIGDEIVFMAPTRHDDGAALTRRVPLGSPRAQPLQDAARGQSGRGIAVDYRGEKVFAAWRSASSLDWGVVTKIDYSEATEGVRAARDRLLLMTFAIGILVVVASIIAAKALVEPLRSLKDATDRISKGNFDVEIDIRSNDELGELADSFERMVAAIKFFREQSHDPGAGDKDEPANRPPSSEE